MIEIIEGGSPFDRISMGSDVVKSLADEGLPDLSCTGEAELMPRCENAITPNELLVRVVHNEDMSSVYLQCLVKDDSDHPDLMVTCLRRVREEIDQ